MNWLRRIINTSNSKTDVIDYRFENYLLDEHSNDYRDEDIRVFTINSLYIAFRDLESYGDIKITDEINFIDNDGNYCECSLCWVIFKFNYEDNYIVNDLVKIEGLLEENIKKQLEYDFKKPYIWIDETQMDKCFQVEILDNFIDNRYIFRIGYYMYYGK